MEVINSLSNGQAQDDTPKSIKPTGEWITLNVGGERMMTTRSTLVQYTDSMLYAMFGQNSVWQHDSLGKQEYNLDCDPQYFRVILNYLRYFFFFFFPICLATCFGRVFLSKFGFNFGKIW
eukprot:TRINITY_DN3272_c0_g3_i3.p1 TRINITY_DN3272_c0_g3~~TRINITY_DN3272_c0_g3_i3.p1  ORF type:complete len:120 (-),score=11.10 TRINITY_DN3272_c0_g3_i3:740-1099(-)